MGEQSKPRPCPPEQARETALSRRRWLAAAAVLSAGLSGARGALAGPRYELEIVKSRRVLLVRNGDAIEREFQVAVGRGGPGDKQQSGDKRTPVGVYRVVDFNSNSRFHYFMHLNYPNVKDAFWGLKKQLITRAQFDRIISALKRGQVPPQNTRLGGLIGIHGIGETNGEKLRIHRSLDWTEGCVALTNTDVEALRHYVTRGTRVVISE